MIGVIQPSALETFASTVSSSTLPKNRPKEQNLDSMGLVLLRTETNLVSAEATVGKRDKKNKHIRVVPSVEAFFPKTLIVIVVPA